MDHGQEFRFLDTEAERQALLAEIRQVRQRVIGFAEQFPTDKLYEPRYHGWSLAAMLAHLHLMDNLSLLQLQIALVGIAPPLSSGALNPINDFMARVFRQRQVATTITGIRANENRIADFILRVPLDRFSKPVYYPPRNVYMTVERAMQQLFLFHWQDHLATMQNVEGRVDEPPASRSED